MVIHVVYECTPEEFRGGVQKVAFELALAQKSLGQQVEIWTFSNVAKQDVTVGAVKIKYLPYTSVFGIKYSRSLALMLKKRLDDIDVIHGHNTFHPINFQVHLFCELYKKKVAYHPHGALDPNLFKGYSFSALKKKIYIRLFEKRVLKAANAIFALTEIEKQQLASLGIDRNVHVIPNGVENKILGNEVKLNEKYDIPKGSFVFLYIGRIVSKKGLHDFITAFSNVIKIRPNCYFIIAGNEQQDPNYTNMLRHLISTFKLQEKVQFFGFVNEANKVNLFNAADVFIHASYSEGMAMSILEAMAYGKPCLVTTGCFMHEAAKNNSVLQVEQSINGLEKGMLELMDSKTLKRELSHNALTFVQQEHSWQNIAQKVIDLYK